MKPHTVGFPAGFVIGALAFASIPVTETLGLSEVLRIVILFSLWAVGFALMLLSCFAGKGKRVPVKKSWSAC